jgi:hypothetical protein
VKRPSLLRGPAPVLAAGAAILLLAVVAGQRMGDQVIQQAGQDTLQSVIPTPLASGADASAPPYGPDWKSSQALTAAGDPHFPDPRVPPQPLPTPLPAVVTRATPTPTPTATPNPNIPIWRQQPLPTMVPTAAPVTPVPAPSRPAPSPQASPGRR